MKILVLVHKSLVPPDKIESKEQWSKARWNTEYDVVSHLKKSGHNVEVLGVDDEIKPIREKIEEFKPKVIFNLLEEFAGEVVFDQHVVSYLELLKQNYTGCGPRGLMLCRDKALAKKILTYHRIATPKFQTYKRGAKIKAPKHFPMFVKSLNEEASFGITQSSIVKDEKSLRERIEHFHNTHGVDVIAEEYVEGRELYVSVIGYQRLQVFPPLELVFAKTPEGSPKIATSKVKWDLNYRKKYGIKTVKAKLNEELLQKVTSVTKRTYRALDLDGYARLDLRVTEAGEVYVIEVNPNPDIGYQEEFADSAELVDIKYPQLLDRILKLALKR